MHLHIEIRLAPDFPYMFISEHSLKSRSEPFLRAYIHISYVYVQGLHSYLRPKYIYIRLVPHIYILLCIVGLHIYIRPTYIDTAV